VEAADRGSVVFDKFAVVPDKRSVELVGKSSVVQGTPQSAELGRRSDEL